jgi:hypothetical protein
VLLTLLWAGAPGPDVRLTRAWRVAASLSIGELVLLWLAITLVSMAIYPLQLRLVRILEGDWPMFLRPAWILSARRQARHRRRLSERALVKGDPPSASEVNRAGGAWTDLHLRFPPTHLAAAPTALGNVLAAMEYSAGASHGLDAVVTWPRLYPLLRPDAKATVDDFRDALDIGCRLAATAALTGVIALGLVYNASGWWLLLVAGILLFARVSYRGAVQAAIGYAVAINAAIDIQRFDLYEALRLPVPCTPEGERSFNEQLSRHWRQDLPHPNIRFRQLHEPPATQPHSPSQTAS